MDPDRWTIRFLLRLRTLRKDLRISQSHIADELELSVSEVSRIERGHRRLRVEQLVLWALALGYRIEILFWESKAAPLDPEELEILRTVAAGIKYMPGPARAALLHQIKLWHQAGLSDAAMASPPDVH